MRDRELNWQTWLTQGDDFLNASKPKGVKSKFGTTIRYNLLSMSMESYIMAILDVHRTLPENHTYTDLINALEATISLDDALKNRILKYESIQSICSVDKFIINEPTEGEIYDLGGAIDELSLLAHHICNNYLDFNNSKAA
jgi:hypothetical protein